MLSFSVGGAIILLIGYHIYLAVALKNVIKDSYRTKGKIILILKKHHRKPL